jgi:beta-glucosidase
LAKAKDFVAQLTLIEKASMITGVQGFDAGGCIGNIARIPRINFTGICLLDGPQTINRTDLVSVFPSGILAGATWDINLIYARARAMGEEFRGKGGHVQLGYESLGLATYMLVLIEK